MENNRNFFITIALSVLILTLWQVFYMNPRVEQHLTRSRTRAEAGEGYLLHVPVNRADRWRPEFLDYLYVAFTTANAFSPTDTMPMVPWAKVAMGSQALISFAIVGLVLARVVNLFQ